MAKTFATLKTAVADYLNRSDISSTVVGEMINFAMRTLEDGQITVDGTLQSHNWNCMQVRQTTTQGTLSTYLTFPSRIKEVSWLKIDRTGSGEDGRFFDLTPATPNIAFQLYPHDDAVSERPKIFALMETQSEILLRPYPDQLYKYDICHYAYHEELSADASHNWWTDYHWDILLFGALLQATPYIVGDPRIPVWKGFYDNAVATLYRQERQKNTAGGYLVIRSYMPSQLRGGAGFDIDIIE